MERSYKIFLTFTIYILIALFFLLGINAGFLSTLYPELALFLLPFQFILMLMLNVIVVPIQLAFILFLGAFSCISKNFSIFLHNFIFPGNTFLFILKTNPSWPGTEGVTLIGQILFWIIFLIAGFFIIRNILSKNETKLPLK